MSLGVSSGNESHGSSNVRCKVHCLPLRFSVDSQLTRVKVLSTDIFFLILWTNFASPSCSVSSSCRAVGADVPQTDIQ